MVDVARFGQVLHTFQTAPWAQQMRLGESTLQELAQTQPRFALTGDGPLEERRFTAENDAARQLVAGTDGERLQAGLQGLLATVPELNDRTRLAGIAFSDSPAGVAFGQALSVLAEHPDVLGVDVLGPMEAAEQAVLGAYLTGFHEFVQDSPWIAFSPTYMAMGPKVSEAFLRHAGPGADEGTPEEIFESHLATGVVLHELLHRSSGPALEDPSAYPSEPSTPDGWGRLNALHQLLEEGSTELLSELPGMRERAHAAMGMPMAPPGTGDFAPYAAFVGVLSGLLGRAGLAVNEPEDAPGIIDILRGNDRMAIPHRLATAIGERHGLDPQRTMEVRRQVEAMGTSNLFNPDLDFDAWQQAFQENARERFAAIDALLSSADAAPET